MSETCDECKVDVKANAVKKCKKCPGSAYCKSCYETHELVHLLGDLDLEDGQNKREGKYDTEDDFEGVAGSMILSRKDPNKDEVTSPDSITLVYKTKDNKINNSISFGIQGSRVGIAMSQISDKNTGDYFYHFGVVLTGNDYTLTDMINAREFKKKHFMLYHLLSDGIEVVVCPKKDDVEESLHDVWSIANEGENVFVFKQFGHSVLSVQLIQQFLNKEKSKDKVDYTFKEMQDCGKKDELAKIYTKEKLQKTTNCFIFVIRFIKLLNEATYNKSKFPKGKDIIKWTGKDTWKYPTEFERMWDHCLKNVEHDIKIMKQ